MDALTRLISEAKRREKELDEIRKNLQKNIALLLKWVRKESKIKQYECARNLGLSNKTISRLESPHTLHPIERLWDCLREYGAEITLIVKIKNKKYVLTDNGLIEYHASEKDS